MTQPTDSNTRLTLEQIKTWPKTELHCHLDGSIRLSTLLEEAKQQGKMEILPADSIDGLNAILKEIDKSDTLEAFLSWFRYSIPLMQSKKTLARAAYELAEDNARENVQYLEVRFSPILHREEGLKLEEVLDAVLDGLANAEKDFGIRTSIIICGLRDRFESASMRLAELAVQYQEKGVTAFDLAGGEAGNPSKDHLSAFYYARNHLLNLTIHAGESWGPESIRQALFFCGAHRIGHGTSLHKDDALVKYMVDHQIPLEICPTSNVQTKVVDSYGTHPLKQYLDAGIPVTINTDNRLFSRTTVSEELLHIHEKNNVSSEQLREVALNGFRFSFLPWEERQDLLRGAIEEFPHPANKHTPIW